MLLSMPHLIFIVYSCIFEIFWKEIHLIARLGSYEAIKISRGCHEDVTRMLPGAHAGLAAAAAVPDVVVDPGVTRSGNKNNI